LTASNINPRHLPQIDGIQSGIDVSTLWNALDFLRGFPGMLK
jgi:hypothetical protein